MSDTAAELGFDIEACLLTQVGQVEGFVPALAEIRLNETEDRDA